jgi:TPR repeat protein
MKYDDAETYYLNFADDKLSCEAGSTHIGMFMAWIIIHDLVCEEESAEEIEKVKSREMTGREFVVECWDCKLLDDALNDEGNEFTAWYYESQYANDYRNAFEVSGEIDEFCSVEDTWCNFDRIAPVLNQRFKEWKQGTAHHTLGVMYLKGEGVPMNPVVAYALFNLAANCRYSDSIAARKQVAQSLSKRAINEARSLGVAMVVSGKVCDSIDEYLSHSLPEAEMYAPGRFPGESDTQYAERLQPLAEKGDPDAQIRLGEIYRTSFVVRRSLTTALKWFRLAAESGSTEAQYKLAGMFEHGHGTPQDYVNAAKWFRQAADNGHVEACFRVGWFQERGWGVDRNAEEAMARYIQAANAGSAGAQLWLSVVYSSGKIVPKDEKESARWERLAAAQGIPTAIGGLAMQYFGGRLVPKSMLIAYALRRLARILNPTDERDTILQVTGERLTAEERETADILLMELAKPDNLLPALERASSEIAP